MKADPELAERLRQFEVVCKIAIQRAGAGCNAGRRNGERSKLHQIGTEEFGLTPAQVVYGIGRTRNFLDEIRELHRARNRAGNWMPKKIPVWHYLDDMEIAA